MEEKVSIITACYNGERFIDRWADSILKQVYTNLEILVINDGSDDNSEEVLIGYKNKFEEKGYIFKYFFQTNKGIGAATNVGLLNMTGKYFMVYDIDDLLDAHCIEKRVEFLECNLDCSAVLTDGYYAHENELGKKYPMRYLSPHLISMKLEKEKIFEKVILGTRGASTCPYMHRTQTYLEINPQRIIPPSPYVQDSQIVLMSCYKHFCGYLNEKLYTVVRCKNSHSHTFSREIEKIIPYLEGQEKAFCDTIDMLPIELNLKNKYKNVIKNRYFEKKNYLIFERLLEEHILPNDIIIFGAGKIGRMVARVAKENGICVKCFADNNSEKWEKNIDNIIVHSIDSIEDELKKYIVIIAVKSSLDQFSWQLENMGLCEGIDFYKYQKFLSACEEHNLLKILSMKNI